VAVITKYIVVRDGVELDQVFADKKEAEAYDKMLDAAQELAVLIKQGDLQIDVDDRTIDEISVYMAKNAPAVAKILKSVKSIKAESNDAEKGPPGENEPVEEKKSVREPKSKAKSRAN
jgi:uncharacterized protein